jgi:Matrixin
MARASKKKSTAKYAAAKAKGSDPLMLRSPTEAAYSAKSSVHIMKKGIRCDTESRGHATPDGHSIFEIVVDASKGFIPLWAKDTTLRWRFRESSLQSFKNPKAAKAAIQQLIAEAILRWGDAAPVKFTKADQGWDFEVVVKSAEDCDVNGCVLASAFFPGGGQQKLTIYPTLFTQNRDEQIETLVHEIGHVFGLRHFFAQLKEASSASLLFGDQSKFTIMNYGPDSKLTDADKADLKKLYQLAWSGKLTQINGTPIKFVKPFHTIGAALDHLIAVAPGAAAVVQPGS